MMTNTGTLTPSRRQALALGLGAVGAVVSSGSIAPAYAENNAEEHIRQFTGGRRPMLGKVRLDLPEIAENGHAIRMAVSVESPMTESAHVTDVLVVADGNSRGGVARFHFSPASGVARAVTFIRLGSKQNVIAVAKMSDGSFYMNRRYVRVAIGGCCS
jgi:sulfur-oxidizing protein SoxY